ncbi:hypothetical protein JCM10908_001638 [Rhodotorula pacifica]|uniref:uncharacterized protein n=1 Tax=Rhodotorula pacifica TaxID=1495444 RepID=UPI00316C5795
MPLSRAPSYTGQSPRQRRGSRPVPLSMSMPPAPTSFVANSTTTNHGAGEQPVFAHDMADMETSIDLFNDGASTQSPPLTAAYFRKAVCRVHDVLYGGRGKDRIEIDQCVRELYDTGSMFENPLTLARGKNAIADMFALLSLVPGTMWSEMGDMTHSQSAFDGNRLVIFSHTLHISLLSFLERETAPACTSGAGSGGIGTATTASGCAPATPSRQRSYSFFSLPGTPYPLTPSAHYGDDAGSEGGHSPGIFSKTYASMTTRDRWPAASLLRALSPRSIASSLATLHLKIHTRLLFNEEGRIISHEDTWGLKEIVEGVFPLGAHLYSVQRHGLGFLASLASRILVPKPIDPPAPTASSGTAAAAEGCNTTNANTATKKLPESSWSTPSTATAEESLARYHQALMMSAPHRKLMNPFSTYGGADGVEPLGAALGLDVGERAKPTTMAMEDE